MSVNESTIDFKTITQIELYNKLSKCSSDDLEKIINDPDFDKECLNTLFNHYYGRTLLYECFWRNNNYIKKARLLLENGANPFLGTYSGDLPYIQFLNKNGEILLKDKNRISYAYTVFKLFAQLGAIPIINKNLKTVIKSMDGKKNWFFTPIDKSDEVLHILIENKFNPTNLIKFIDFKDEFSNEIENVVNTKSLLNSIRCILKDTLELKNEDDINKKIESLIKLSNIDSDGFWCYYYFLDHGIDRFRSELIKRSKLFELDFETKSNSK